MLKGKGFSALTKACLEEAEKDDVQQIVDLDRLYFGVSRKRMLESILLNLDNLCFVSKDDGRILGFSMAEIYDGVAVVGPMVCEQGYYDIAKDLLKIILKRLKGHEVPICVPEKEFKILNTLTRYGFTERRTLIITTFTWQNL